MTNQDECRTDKVPTREFIIDAWKKADKGAEAKGERPIGRSGICRILNISTNVVQTLWAGESLTEMKRQNGIRLSPQEIHFTEDELFSKFDQLVTERGAIPPWKVLTTQTGISEKTWKKNSGGGKEKVNQKYANYYACNRAFNERNV